MALIARLLNPLVWRWPGRAPRRLYSFAQAEHGSLLDLTEAAHLTPSPKRAALYLKHAGDEARHARVFAARSAVLRQARGHQPLGEARADSDQLFRRLGETGFLAFVHIGERGGREQFEAHERFFRARGSDDDASMFAAILTDERRHERYTRELLVEIAGSEQDARRALRRANRWRLWRTWRRVGVGLASRVYQLAMLAVYVVALPIALMVMLLRRPSRGWKSP